MSVVTPEIYLMKLGNDMILTKIDL